ncbi:mitochondrial ribosomal protein subunit L20-domain-containing protein [Hypoxylon trugodes]|uniref:mitochondrial ribosomal protein subunit L20-domain-containing protein n=1 Tax=Hypoxylon trugodes TaxID=326681 RepID=UPI0021A0AD36|nr:mitochondrial ribosomal protein subunit L20-domain-containing protein [Hypoxylon trugodes]KAI1389539.1 mitochondrial ribosomal protein subunit L20-domain-containing protein [Hypoxylon trugodes]
METRTIMQPLLRCLNKPSSTRAVTATTTSTTPSTTQKRHQSTTSRTKRALKIAPHSSFLQPTNSSQNIIFNPPSSAPSVYHTPFKFLPPSDPRRQANISQLLRTSPTPNTSSQNFPELKHHNKKYNVTLEQVAEIRKLRAEDPKKWSVLALAAKYECAPLFVMMCCKSAPEHRAREHAKLEAVKARWGPIRTKAREERKKRKELLMQDAL